MHYSSLLLLLGLMIVAAASGQTFHYSKGWTNGRKRSATSAQRLEDILTRAESDQAFKRILEAAWQRVMNDNDDVLIGEKQNGALELQDEFIWPDELRRLYHIEKQNEDE